VTTRAPDWPPAIQATPLGACLHGRNRQSTHSVHAVETHAAQACLVSWVEYRQLLSGFAPSSLRTWGVGVTYGL
jgi:hypothetical protein